MTRSSLRRPFRHWRNGPQAQAIDERPLAPDAGHSALSRQSRNPTGLRRRVPHGAMVTVLMRSPPPRSNAMLSFLTKFAAVVRGVLSGLDRVFFCGTPRSLAHGRGLQHYLGAHRIPDKDFAAHSLEVTA